MAFEYSTQGATLDFPNPYRIENQFLAARALALLAAGVTLLVMARGAGSAVTMARPDAMQGGVVLLVLFAVTWLITPNPAAQALAALVYLLLGSVLILRSYIAGTSGTVALKPLRLAGLLVFGIVGTVLIGRVAAALPQPAWLGHLSLPLIAFVLLLASLVIELLGLVAGFAHVDAPPPASTASEQVAVSFNADPNLLLQEVDRELQRRWTQDIPNRRYVWQPPVLEPARGAGNFSGTALEEKRSRCRGRPCTAWTGPPAWLSRAFMGWPRWTRWASC